MESVTLRFPSQPRLLRIVRGAVSAAATTMGFTEREVGDICMAVDEACANIIRHSYGGPCDEMIEVECELAADRLVVRLRDTGAPFHPDQLPSREVEDVRPGGLGLHLITQIMDEVQYLPGPNAGTELVLTKYGALHTR